MRERGSTPIELAVGVAVLLLPAAMLVLSFAPWLRARTFVRVAAADAARAVVIDVGDATRAMSGIGAGLPAGEWDTGDIRVSLCGAPATVLSAVDLGSCRPLIRDGTVAIEVLVDVPMVVTPYGPVGGLTVSHRHVERVDRYRSLP